MDIRLDLKLAQKLVMTPQLQQAIKLLQLSRLELSQVVSQELEENPLLEESVSEMWWWPTLPSSHQASKGRKITPQSMAKVQTFESNGRLSNEGV